MQLYGTGLYWIRRRRARARVRRLTTLRRAGLSVTFAVRGPMNESGEQG